VQDVLGYISLQTRRRFDLYSFGLSAYEEVNSAERPASGGAGTSREPTYQFYAQPARSSRQIPTSPPPNTTAAPPPRVATAATAAAQAVPAERLFRYVVDLGDEQFDYTDQVLPSNNMLTALLAGMQPRTRATNRVDELSAIANILLRMGGAVPQQGLEPVVVRPTVEQIARATEIATSDTEQDCAICQDTITTTQQCRKIRHCGHWFHKDCIDPWFHQNVQCPICRYDIRDYQVSPEESSSTPAPRTSYPEEDYH
jgi:hypothetical protein